MTHPLPKWLFLPLITVGLATAQLLPPELPWEGESSRFQRDPSDAWATPAEQDDLVDTPDYDTTIAWLHRLADAAPQLTMRRIGRTGQQRDLWMVIASETAVEQPGQLPTDRPTLLFHGGIHSGEIDGKDAGMMFLRDLVLNEPDRLKHLNVLFIPVLNPDGHERRSPFNRVNQRGPTDMGWRTNARNRNLNRDFTKLETPEVRALVRIFNRWPVDLYLDIHVTDGVDYQHDITFGFNDATGYSPEISGWLTERFTPSVNRLLTEEGHISGPLIMAVDNRNFESGTTHWSASPRYSNGYGDARHLPSVLVENHSLKNYRQRVLGTYVLLEATSRILAAEGRTLQQAIARDRDRRPPQIPMGWTAEEPESAHDKIEILGVDYETFDSPISGAEEVRWLGTPRSLTIPHVAEQPTHQIDRPTSYWVPAERREILRKLRNHGIRLETIHEPTRVRVELYRLIDTKLDTEPYEGRVRLEVEQVQLETHERVYPPGSVRIDLNQPLGDLAMLLLEPLSEDSFLQWGFFHDVLQRTEYIEGYIVEPLARQMLEDDPALRRAFAEALQDEAFAQDRARRLQWFYERSPYYDPEYLLYPIGREISE